MHGPQADELARHDPFSPYNNTRVSTRRVKGAGPALPHTYPKRMQRDRLFGLLTGMQTKNEIEVTTYRGRTLEDARYFAHRHAPEWFHVAPDAVIFAGVTAHMRLDHVADHLSDDEGSAE